MPNICYHTRLNSDPAVKVVGGSFGGSIDQDTVRRLVKHHFTVTVRPSGTAVFVDRKGREVSLYLTVDPATTDQGAAALKAWRQQQARQEAEVDGLREQQQDELDELMAGLTHEEVVARLRRTS